MKLVDRMEKWIRPFAIPNIIVGIIVLQVMLFLMIQTNSEFAELCVLNAQLVKQGQVWRLFSFLVVPPLGVPFIFLFFHWYLLYLMGNALEQEWGAARFNLFLLIGYLANLLVAFLVPGGYGTNLFLFGTVFLAFAQLFPTFTLMLFFILPIQIRWLAMMTWVLYGWQFLTGTNINRVLILASVCNFLLFFGPEMIAKARGKHRRMQTKIQHVQMMRTPRNTCAVCGLTNLDDPQAEFRYCSKCVGEHCYCMEHLTTHEHVLVESTPGSTS